MGSWLTQRADGVVLNIQVQPGVSHPGIRVDESSETLRVRLSTPPVEGKANAALIAALAKKLRVAKSSITIERGHSSRRKTVHVSGMSESQVRSQLQS